MAELQQGGVIYLLGVVFFKLDGRLPLAHAIWHLHVVIASMIHYHAVDKYLISPEEWKKDQSTAFLKIEMNYVCQQFENYEMHYTYLSDTYMNLALSHDQWPEV